MDNIIDQLDTLISRIEYGDITREDIIKTLRGTKTDVEDVSHYIKY